MSFCVGSSYFHVNISNEKIRDIYKRDTPPEMSLWEKIKDFFCLTHQAEALDCIYKLCHPPAGTTLKDVESTFDRLKKLAYPGWEGNIQSNIHGINHFRIMDQDGREILAVIIHDDYTTAVGCSGNSYALTPPDPFGIRSVSSRLELRFSLP